MPSRIGHDTPPAEWLTDSPSLSEVEEIVGFLTSEGTFEFPTLKSGLFAAAAGGVEDLTGTGYHNCWTRDNVHVAHALWASGETSVAAGAVSALLRFYIKHRQRFVDIIEDNLDPEVPMNRPHVRFEGENLEELPQRWAHAQNDALGYLLWLSCRLLRTGDLQPSEEIEDLFRMLVWYFDTIEYWHDEDSGHWEETRKIEASSIGTVVAGLQELKAWLSEGGRSEIDRELLLELIEEGEAQMAHILPAECIQEAPGKSRRYDAALLFLIEPLETVSLETADQILNDIRTHLMGPIGIRRYIGDSYWCADYRDLLAPEVRTTDYSDDTSARDALLKPGEEAQWCIFDPLLSVIYGKRYLDAGDEADRKQQVHHLRRSLGHLTVPSRGAGASDPAPSASRSGSSQPGAPDSRFPPYRCPESYFLEHGKWVPNDITPLLWTQANLKLALHWMKRSAAKG